MRRFRRVLEFVNRLGSTSRDGWPPGDSMVRRSGAIRVGPQSIEPLMSWSSSDWGMTASPGPDSANRHSGPRWVLWRAFTAACRRLRGSESVLGHQEVWWDRDIGNAQSRRPDGLCLRGLFLLAIFGPFGCGTCSAKRRTNDRTRECRGDRQRHSGDIGTSCVDATQGCEPIGMPC